MSSSNAAEWVQTAVRELGHLKPSDLGRYVGSLPAMSRLLRAENCRKEMGCHGWLHACSSWAISERWLKKRRSARQIVDRIIRKRRIALAKLFRFLEQKFQADFPGADPSEFRLIILNGWWLRETTIANFRGEKIKTLIDATYRFERVAQREPVHVVPGPVA